MDIVAADIGNFTYHKKDNEVYLNFSNEHYINHTNCYGPTQDCIIFGKGFEYKRIFNTFVNYFLWYYITENMNDFNELRYLKIDNHNEILYKFINELVPEFSKLKDVNASKTRKQVFKKISTLDTKLLLKSEYDNSILDGNEVLIKSYKLEGSNEFTSELMTNVHLPRFIIDKLLSFSDSFNTFVCTFLRSLGIHMSKNTLNLILKDNQVYIFGNLINSANLHILTELKSNVEYFSNPIFSIHKNTNKSNYVTMDKEDVNNLDLIYKIGLLGLCMDHLKIFKNLGIKYDFREDRL